MSIRVVTLIFVIGCLFAQAEGQRKKPTKMPIQPGKTASVPGENSIGQSNKVLVPFLKGDYYGYSDVNKKLVIEAKYEKVSFFEEGLANVKLNGKYGFIDLKGKVVIPFAYDYASPFSEGLAYVIINNKWGSIDKSGNVVIPLIYDDVRLCRNGLIPVWLNGKSGFIDKTGKAIVPLKYSNSLWFRENLALVNLNGKYGFVDESGNEAIPIKYDNASDFARGLATAQLNGKYGVIDKSGKTVIPFVYDYVFPFHYDFTFVKLNGKYGYIDKAGRMVIPIEYDEIGLLGYGLGFPTDNLVSAKQNGKWGYLDTGGKIVVPFIYDWAGGFQAGIAPVALKGKFGFINKTGKIIAPPIYDSAHNDGEGMAIVSLNGKYGFVDTTGKLVIPTKYEHPGTFPHTGLFKNGLANIILDGKEIYIAKNGTEYYEPAGKGGPPPTTAMDYSEKYGYILRNGSFVVTYKAAGNDMVFTLEATDDFTNNMGGKDGIVDSSSIHVDVNKNGKIDRGLDTLYGIAGTTPSTLCSAHFMSAMSTTICGEFRSLASVTASFAGSPHEIRPHPIWVYTIPQSELSQDGIEAHMQFLVFAAGKDGTRIPLRTNAEVEGFRLVERVRLYRPLSANNGNIMPINPATVSTSKPMAAASKAPPAKHGSPGYYFTINTCNACCYDWHNAAAKSFSSKGMPATVVAGQERAASATKGFAPLQKFEKFYFKDVTRDSEICAQGTLYVGPFPTQNSALKAVDKFPPLLLSIIKNRGTEDMYSPKQLRLLETATVVQNGTSNNWRYGNDDFFTISGYQLVQSQASLKSDAAASWPLFWAKFSKAVNQKDFTALVNLSASDEDFFDGGGGGNSLDWFKMMSEEWPLVKKAVMTGVTPIKIYDWYGETRVERTTRKQEMIFLYAGQRWFFFGVMGD